MIEFGSETMDREFASESHFTSLLSVLRILRRKRIDTCCINTQRLLHIIIFFFSLCLSSGQIVMGEQCDWTGSGLEMNGGKWVGESRGVTPVYLRCYQGRVSWVYPRGGLRVVLRHGPTGKDFRGCVRVNPSFAGARIFAEDRRYLRELYSPGDGQPVRLARCFRSRYGQAVLYLEAAPPSISAAIGLFPKYLAEFSYDLEPVKPNTYDPVEECKPCDREELLRAFCTNDLVASGFIEAIRQEEGMDESEITVRVEKFLKYSSFDTNYIAKDETSRKGNELSDPTVSITMPKMCQSKPGSGQFVFMARKRFDDYTLVCAPRWEDWKQLVAVENQKDDSHCVLSF